MSPPTLCDFVRRATIMDIEAMHRIRCAVRENALSSPDRITPDDYRHALANGRSWVIDPGFGIAGFAFGQNSGNVWALFVDPDHEGHGYGSALHGVMIDWLQTHAARPIWLTTGTGTRAEGFYRAQGWQDCGLTPSGERRFEWPETALPQTQPLPQPRS